MQKSAQNIYKDCKSSHEHIYTLLAELRGEIDRCNNYVELCDYAFAVDQSHDFIEDLKKELWKFKESIIRKVCELWLEDMVKRMRADRERSIRTDYVTATPDIKQAPIIPTTKADPAAYKQLMDYLGVDTSKWGLRDVKNGKEGEKELNEVMQLHWPSVVNLVNEKLAKGEPCPPGFDMSKTTPVYKLTMRKKKNILDNVDVVE